MACKCQKPCKKDICCSVCDEVEACKVRCETCAPKAQVKKEESNTTKKED